MLKNNKRLLFLTIVISLFALAGIVVRYVSSIAYLEIHKNQGGPEVTFTINQTNSHTITGTLNTLNKKIRIKRGGYSVFLKSSDGTYFEAGTARGFWSSAKINPQYEKENKKTYLAENSATCFFKNTVFISYICGASLSNVKIHPPANNTSPQYAKKSSLSDSFSVNVMANAKTQMGEALLIKYDAVIGSGDEGFDETASDESYYLYFLSQADNISKKVKLGDLKNSLNYKLKSTDGRLLIYSKEDAYYFDTSSMKLTKLTIPKKGFQIQDIDIQNDIIAASLGTDKMDPKGKQQKSKVTLLSKGKELASKNLSNGVDSLAFCHKDYLCIKSGSEVLTFNTSNNRLTPVAAIPGIKKLYKSNLKTIFISDDGIIEYNPATQKGYSSFSFGSYVFLSINDTIVTLRGNKKQFAIEYNPQEKESNSITDKISELEKIFQIKELSISNNIIYFTPNISLTYNTNTKQMEYDRQILNKTNQQIINKATELGIIPEFTLISTIR